MEIAITGSTSARTRELADPIDRKLRFAFSRFGHLVWRARLQLTRSGCRLVLDLSSGSPVTALGAGADPLAAVDHAIAKALKSVVRASARMPLAVES